MAAAGTYYIDTINFADANEVFLDEALTTCAPNGFYQMGGATAREQVDCVGGVGGRLLDPVTCPSCTPPSQDAPIPANTSYKVTDVVTGTIAFVAITTDYQPTQKITTSLSTNCWLINNGSTDTVTATITGSCNTQTVPIEKYYLLNPCPNSVPSSNEYVFTYIIDSATDKPPINGRYLDTTTGQFYTSANTAHPEGSSIPNIGSNNRYNTDLNVNLALQGSFPSDPVNLGCPPPPERFCYWNATPCSGGSKVIIKTPTNVFDSITQGTSSVKVSGTCYTIDNLSLCTSDEVDDIGLYDGTVYSACDSAGTGDNPCILAVVPTPSFNVVETTSGATDLVTKRNGFGQNSKVVITGLAGCWNLVSPSTTATANTIQDFCPAVSSCTTYQFTGTGYYITCSAGAGGSQSYLNLSPGITQAVCAITGSVAASNGGSSGTGSCNTDIPLTPQYNYYNVELCSGGGATVVRVPVGTTLDANQSVRINNGVTCYKVTGGSGLTTTQDATNITSGCDICDPPVTCFSYSIEYSSGTTVCLAGGQGVVFGDTNNFLTATQLFASQAGCTTSEAASSGVYTFTSANIKTSRYWNGSTLGAAQTCSSTPQSVTATITAIDTTGLTGGVAGTNYNLSGDIISSFISGTAPLDTNPGTFNTRVLVTQGFTGTGINISYAPTDINSDQNVTMTITGAITQDASSFVYSVTGCDNTFWNIESTQVLSQGSTIKFSTNGGQVLCGIVGQQQPSSISPTGNFMYQVSSGNNCNSFQC
tara:strand:+ start:1866 stop:4148 length:2283 start_codon:yes stop_codon:yes gene_type:complete